ncbi:MAG: hypothetical protein ACHQ15_03410 [Candidatus Limnocylindrales bacterium]
MNDFVAGVLARERQADYMREVEGDELAALAHRAPEGGPAPTGTSRASAAAHHHRWHDLLDLHFRPRPPLHGHR